MGKSLEFYMLYLWKMYTYIMEGEGEEIQVEDRGLRMEQVSK